MDILGQITDWTVVYFGFSILFAFLFLFFVFWFTWRTVNRPNDLSPYTAFPLRPAKDLSYFVQERVILYLRDIENYENQVFDLKKASFCRETGRIFSNTITWYGGIRCDWSFIKKRFPGNFVSWGSLTLAQKEAIEEAHESLEGFQTEESSRHPAPRLVEPKFAYSKPGPLYVEVETQVLLGWKIVPETDVEVLIVQKPKKSALEIYRETRS